MTPEKEEKKNVFPSVGREFDTPTRLPTFSCRFPGDFFFYMEARILIIFENMTLFIREVSFIVQKNVSFL